MLHQEPTSLESFVALRIPHVRPYQSFFVGPCGILVAVADFARFCNFETCYVVHVVARDIYERNPALICAVEVVDGDGVQIVGAVPHGAVIAVPVKVRPAENHVAAFVYKDVDGKFAGHVRHLMVRQFHAIAFFVGPSRMGP